LCGIDCGRRPFADGAQGKILTNIEPPAEINDVSLAHVHRPTMPSMVTPMPAPDSGLIMIAGESERVMTFFVPELGMAPKWYAHTHDPGRIAAAMLLVLSCHDCAACGQCAASPRDASCSCSSFP
jgi:hypothetical protein